MTLLWVVAGVSLVASLVAWRGQRANGRRLEQLVQMYWELKYQHDELRASVQRQNGEGASVSPANPVARSSTGFVPLSSLKR